MTIPVAGQKALEVFPAAVDTGLSSRRNSKKMAAPVATQKVGEASLMAVDAGPPPEKICEREEAPVAAEVGWGTSSGRKYWRPYTESWMRVTTTGVP
jgi:hypothetical protein